jgi:Retroviral aspartyl protease
VSVGLTRNVLHPIIAELDTGAGPNLIRKDLLPKNWDVYRIPGLQFPRITNASGRRIAARGVVQLHVQVGGLVRRVCFYVTTCLAVPCILGCNFISLHAKAILPKEQKVLLQEGGTVAI